MATIIITVTPATPDQQSDLIEQIKPHLGTARRRIISGWKPHHVAYGQELLRQTGAIGLMKSGLPDVRDYGELDVSYTEEIRELVLLSVVVPTNILVGGSAAWRLVVHIARMYNIEIEVSEIMSQQALGASWVISLTGRPYSITYLRPLA